MLNTIQYHIAQKFKGWPAYEKAARIPRNHGKRRMVFYLSKLTAMLNPLGLKIKLLQFKNADMITKKLDKNFEVGEVYGDNSEMKISIKGINNFSNSEIREIIEDAFLKQDNEMIAKIEIDITTTNFIDLAELLCKMSTYSKGINYSGPSLEMLTIINEEFKYISDKNHLEFMEQFEKRNKIE